MNYSSFGQTPSECFEESALTGKKKYEKKQAKSGTFNFLVGHIYNVMATKIAQSIAKRSTNAAKNQFDQLQLNDATKPHAI